jgi:hypothetical protein
MSAYSNLMLYITRHVFKRGAFKGDAPADSSRRSKVWFRVIKPSHEDGPYIVRFHNADIIRAYKDGTIMLDTAGWHASPTTRDAMYQALTLCGFRGFLHSKRLGTYSQTALQFQGTQYAYYDGMTFNADGVLTTAPIQWTTRIKDREQTKAFREATKPFWDMFPVLFCNRPPEAQRTALDYAIIRQIHVAPMWVLTEHPDMWPMVVGYYCHGKYAESEMRTARSYLMSELTKGMTKLVKVSN